MKARWQASSALWGRLIRKRRLTSYEERLKLYLVGNNRAANDAKAERCKAIFLSEEGKEIFQFLSDLFSPDKPADNYEPVPNEMAESFKFWTRVQAEDESVKEEETHCSCKFIRFEQMVEGQVCNRVESEVCKRSREIK